MGEGGCAERRGTGRRLPIGQLGQRGIGVGKNAAAVVAAMKRPQKEREAGLEQRATESDETGNGSLPRGERA